MMKRGFLAIYISSIVSDSNLLSTIKKERKKENQKDDLL